MLNSPPYDCAYFKRAPDRSIGQRIEIASISGNTLTTAASLNYEAKASYSIRIRGTDEIALARSLYAKYIGN